MGTLGTILLCFAFSIPAEKIRNNVEASIDVLKNETDYFQIIESDIGTRLDNYTEAYYLNEALVDSSYHSPLNSALSGYCYVIDGNENLPPVENLAQVLESNNDVIIQSRHKRFFCGYELILKPTLTIASYSTIRNVNLVLSIILFIILVTLMIKKNLGSYIPAISISLLLIHPLTIVKCMTFVGYYYCSIIPCIIILLIDKNVLQKKAWLLFSLTGACVFFFNMNYFQLISFAMPLMLYFLVLGLPNKTSESLKSILNFFMAWFMAYAGMMVFKWLLYGIIVDSSIFSEMLALISRRTSTSEGSRFYGITSNINVIKQNTIWIYTEIVFCIFSIIMIVKNKCKVKKKTGPMLALLLIMSILPMARYLIFSNHVIIHNWVMYRLIMIPVLSYNLAITKLWNNNGFEQ